MNRHVVIGLAALVGALSAVEQAQAVETCSDLRNRARQNPDNRDMLDDLRDQAIADGCEPPVVRAIEKLLGDDSSPETGDTATVAATVAATPAPRTQPATPRPRAAPARLILEQTARGALTANSATDPSGVPYDLWSIQAEADQTLSISMAAAAGSDLDTYLVVGRMRNGQFEEIAHDDDGGESFNALLRFTPQETGEHLIRARSYAAGSYGAYTLRAEAINVSPPVTRPLRIGEPVAGDLSVESAIDQESGAAHELWSFQARAGQRLRISMTAPQGSSLDTYLVVGRDNEGRFEELASNDDRAQGDFNSLVRFLPPESGEYVIRARAYASGQHGRYELLVEETRFTVAARVPIARDSSTNAWLHEGALSASPGGDHVDFIFEPRRGRRYNVRAFSNEFSPVVEIARLAGDDTVTEIDVFNPTASTRAADAAEFVAQGGGNYVLRVSADNLQTGRFNLIVTESR